MFWQEKPEEKNFETSNEVVDLCFKLQCKTLPLDHAWPLSAALLNAAPWLKSSAHSAIHLIHGAESGNGWIRPDNTDNEWLHLSRRARFTLRLHRDKVALAEDLVREGREGAMELKVPLVVDLHSGANWAEAHG